MSRPDTNIFLKYVLDTSRIATTNEQRWVEEQRPKITRDVDTVKRGSIEFHTALSLTNPTGLFITATLRCNFKIYGESVEFPGKFDGQEVWECLPYRKATQSFGLNELLARKGKTFEQMWDERNSQNANQQLTMDLETTMENELGRTGEVKMRRYYFDFIKHTWQAVVTRPK